MKAPTLLLGATLLALIPSALHAKIDRVVEKTFTVQPGGTIKASTSGGNITVEPSSGDTVKVVAKEHIRASTEAEADELLHDLELTIARDGNDVTATAKHTNHFWGTQKVQVDFVITVPARYSAHLNTSGGDLKVGDLEGRVHARTSGGNVRLGKITGEVDAGTSGGNVDLESGSESVKLSTSGGNIRVEHAVGPTDASTSGGNVEIGSVENRVHAETSGGDVSAKIQGMLKGDCDLETSGGTVRATVAKNAAFDLDAHTSGGSVRADGLTITIDGGGVGKSRLSGKVNGGGPRLKLHTSGGDVVIETR